MDCPSLSVNENYPMSGFCTSAPSHVQSALHGGPADTLVVDPWALAAAGFGLRPHPSGPGGSFMAAAALFTSGMASASLGVGGSGSQSHHPGVSMATMPPVAMHSLLHAMTSSSSPPLSSPIMTSSQFASVADHVTEGGTALLGLPLSLPAALRMRMADHHEFARSFGKTNVT
jgi:hypothetical protein